MKYIYPETVIFKGLMIQVNYRSFSFILMCMYMYIYTNIYVCMLIFRWRMRVTMVTMKHAASSCQPWPASGCVVWSAFFVGLRWLFSVATLWSTAHYFSVLDNIPRPALR